MQSELMMTFIYFTLLEACTHFNFHFRPKLCVEPDLLVSANRPCIVCGQCHGDENSVVCMCRNIIDDSSSVTHEPLGLDGKRSMRINRFWPFKQGDSNI